MLTSPVDLTCIIAPSGLPAPGGSEGVSRHVCDLYERERLLTALDLHDGLAQYLSSAMLYFEASRASADPETAETSWTKGMGLLTHSIAELRRLMRRLQPAILDHCGLVGAVSELVESHCRDSGVDIQFDHHVLFDRLFPPLETSLFCIIQESLENACRHSQSQQIWVAMTQRGKQIHVEIRDCGVGFDPANVDQTRFGMRGIRKRAELFGGHTTIHSAPGDGTQILVDLPLIEVQPV